MTELTKRATVYLDPELHKALRLKSVETSRSMSELINEAIREELGEDAEELRQGLNVKLYQSADFKCWE
jgi:post-segregation antitoxin (ccd killing protein)